MHPFLDRVSAEIESLLRVAAPPPADRGPGLLVALSGGPDSTALLLAAAAWAADRGGLVAAAHLNHLLRGAESDADEEFCRGLCARLDVELRVRRADAAAAAREGGRGEEEAGRRLRREFLAEVLDSDPRLDCCATGHHRDDQTETVVMRIFRGCGLDGLRGIRPIGGRIIHPLLGIRRAEIEAFLADSGQRWRTDRTNFAGGAARSRIRHELLPLARDILGEGVDAGPARLAELAERDAACLIGQAREFVDSLEGRDIPAAAILGLPRPVAARALRILLAERCGLDQDLEMVHLDSLLDWLENGRSGSGVDIVGGRRAWRDGDRLVLLGPDSADPDRECDLSLIDSFHILKEEADPADQADPRPEPGEVPAPVPGRRWSLTMPAGALAGEPRLRLRRPGDRIVPLGMSGSKKVGDLLSERKVPHADRARALVVEDDEGLLWVVGLVRAERTRLLPGRGAGVTLTVFFAAEGPETGAGAAGRN